MYFKTALSVVLLAFFYMIPGYLTTKIGKTKAEHLPTLSGILLYIGTPFMVISSFLSLPYSRGGLAKMAQFFLLTFVIQTVFFLLVFFLSGGTKNAARRMIAMGATCGNVGFFGIPIVRALFPDNPEVACYAVCFTLSMNLLVFTLGVFCLTGEKKYVSVKHAVCNPSVFGLAIGLPLYLLGWGAHLPDLLLGGIHTLGGLTTPLCMFILGIRLASAKPKTLFCDGTAYAVSALKLVVFPLFCLVAGKIFSPDAAFYGSLVILASTPCAAIILSLAEIYHSREQSAASCILLSMLLCVVTIPLMALIL